MVSNEEIEAKKGRENMFYKFKIYIRIQPTPPPPYNIMAGIKEDQGGIYTSRDKFVQRHRIFKVLDAVMKERVWEGMDVVIYTENLYNIVLKIPGVL